MPPLLAALLLTALTWMVSLPLSLRTARVAALDLFLLVSALVNLRLAFRRVAGTRAPIWFWPAGLGVAALITYRAVSALTS